MRARNRSRLAMLSDQLAEHRSSFVGRQPVFDRQLEVAAYEILLRDGPVDAISMLEADSDTPVVRLNNSLDIDLASITGGKPALLAVTPSVIHRGVPGELTSLDVGLIIGSSFVDVDEVVPELTRLKSQGLRMILDNPKENHHLQSLRRVADGVRVPVSRSNDAELGVVLSTLGAAKPHTVADRVDSYQRLRDVRRLGFSLFQGQFFGRPDVLKKRRVPAARLTTLGLIALLQDPDSSIAHLAELIRRDVSLSYRILQVANSAYYSLPRPLDSIEAAVMVIGTRQLADWVGLIKLKEMAAKPDELTVTAMIRAQACEEIVTTLHPSHAAASYTVGLFSVLEALLDTPMADILEPLSLADEIVAALVDGTGVAGQVLQGVIAYEQARWDDARIEGIDDDAMSGIMRRAIDKTTRMWREVVE